MLHRSDSASPRSRLGTSPGRAPAFSIMARFSGRRRFMAPTTALRAILSRRVGAVRDRERLRQRDAESRCERPPSLYGSPNRTAGRFFGNGRARVQPPWPQVVTAGRPWPSRTRRMLSSQNLKTMNGRRGKCGRAQLPIVALQAKRPRSVVCCREPQSAKRTSPPGYGQRPGADAASFRMGWSLCENSVPKRNSRISLRAGPR
jgi:hypothetical protein